MPTNSPLGGQELIEVLQQVHAEDVARARALVDMAIAEADAAWIPRNATRDALLAALRFLAAPPTTPRPDA